MQSLPEQRFLKFHPDTLSYIRREFNLDRPGDMDKAIDVLEDWLKKQNHFTVKTFPRDYVERQIIFNKGSVERAKYQIDKLFTMKTTATTLLGRYDVKRDFEGLRNVLGHTLMPNLTKDHHRLYVGKVFSNGIADTLMLTKLFSFVILIYEFMRAFEYSNGFVTVYDLREVNILELVAQMSISELIETLGYLTKGYQIRVKGIHFISTSKTIEVFVKILRQIFSAKIGQRIFVHMDMKSLHEHVSKDDLPEEFGGVNKSILALCDEFTEELGREENVEHFKEMAKAVVNESLRVGDGISRDDMLGMSGTFRNICID